MKFFRSTPSASYHACIASYNAYKRLRVVWQRQMFRLEHLGHSSHVVHAITNHVCRGPAILVSSNANSARTITNPFTVKRPIISILPCSVSHTIASAWLCQTQFTTALIVYDYCITFNDEILYMWRYKRSERRGWRARLTLLLFLATRYVALIYSVIGFIASLVPLVRYLRHPHLSS